MKKFILCLLLVVFLVCGCTRIEVKSFSYTEDYNYYKNCYGLKQPNYVNTEKTEVKDAYQAVELAKKECNVEYDSIAVAFDEDCKIYRISFYKRNWLGGNQDVYINLDGLTQLIIYGE